MALSFAFDTSKGETPETVAQRRQMSNLIAARMLGTAPKNVGEGLNAIGQALIARSMMGEADAAQKAGEASLPDWIKGQITGQSVTPSVATPPAVAAAPMGGTSIPVSQADTGPVVPTDANAMPGTVGMNLALADRSQDFIQDNPGTAMSSGVRSTADQQRLYDNRASNPNPVARPGTSNHERGMAIDIGGMTPAQRSMLPQYGLAQPVANDPPHVELAKATDASSPLDTAQWPAGPVGAPGTQVAQAAPQSANDGAELPANAQPTGGALPTAQAVQQASQPRSQSYGGPFANVSTQDLTKAAFNPWLKASNPAAAAAISAEITRRATMDQQASDPMRALDMQTKQLSITPLGQPYKDADGNLVQKDALGKVTVLSAADKTPNSVGEYGFYAKQETDAGRVPLPYGQWDVARRRSGATNVNTGTIPKGYEQIQDPVTGAISMRAIPGGPADTSKHDKVKADAQATSSDVITNAAKLAQDALASPGLPASGTVSTALSPVGETNAAELRRQIDVLKANASIETLNQMRQQSKTGGALGSVTEGEERLLAAKSGALDPKAPPEKLKAAINDYERTLLQVVHGKEAGDKIYNSAHPAPPATPDGMMAVNPKTGERLIRQGGKWVPVT